MLKLKVFNYQTGEFQETQLKPEIGTKVEWIIGRASNCDIVLPHPLVSRVHGRIGFQAGQYSFTDFGSTDGSRINNALVSINQTYPLKPEDVIRIGEFVLVVDAIEPAAETSTPAQAKQSWQDDLTVRCVQIVPETADTKTFSFVAEPAVSFNYLPGQFVTLELNINGETIQRCYSISSSPSRSHTLDITVKRVPADQPHLPAGLVSNWLHDQLQVGSQIKLKGGAIGKFTCAPQPAAKLLLLSAGSGITPMVSMLRWLYDTASNCDVVFFHSARTPQDIILRQELEWLTSRRDNFRLAFTITRPELGQPWYGLTGRLHESMLYNIAPDFQERTVYVCGSASFMEGTKSLFSRLSFPMEQYHAESFGGAKKRKPPATTPANGNGNGNENKNLDVNNNGNGQHSKGKQPVSIPPASSPSSSPHLVFVNSGQEVAAEAGLSILELADQEGIRIRRSCKQGVCGACRIRKREGAIKYDAEPTGLSEADQADGYILPCIATPCDRVLLEA